MCDTFDRLLHCPRQGGEFEATGLQPADKGNHGADSPAEAEADAAHQEEEDEEMVELAAGAEPQSIPKRSATSAEPQLHNCSCTSLTQFTVSQTHYCSVMCAFRARAYGQLIICQGGK